MNCLNELFNETDLYSKETFKVFELEGNAYNLNEGELERLKKCLGIDQENIVTFCHKCKKEFPFEIEKKYLTKHFEHISGKPKMIITSSYGNYGAGEFDIESGNIYGPIPPYTKDKILNNEICYVEYRFRCKNETSHIYLMIIALEFNNGNFTIRKVGQNPSMLTIKGFDFDKYKKQLNRINAYEDYKKADLSNAEHFYVGAYAYLRRIFEKLIKYYIDKHDITLDDNRMETKIDSVKQYFDPRISKLLKNLYGILSVSIHELDEDESKDYYTYLKAIIDMQLEFEFTEEEKAEQSSELSAIINKIENGLKNKKK